MKRIKINNKNHDLFFAIYGYKLGETRKEAVFLIFFLREDWSPALLPVSSTSWSDLELKTTTISLVRWRQVSTSSPKSGCGKSPDLDAVRREEIIERGS